jgi:hypothetical protein
MKNELGIYVMIYNKLDLFKDLFNSYKRISQHDNVKLYIIDDSSNNEIYNYVKNLNLDKINYLKNEYNLGHDNNYYNIYNIIIENYFWIIPDSFNISDFFIIHFFKTIKNNEYDLFLLNINNRLNYKKYTINDFKINNTMNYLWHTTLTGSVIYNKKVLNNYNITHIPTSKNFPQVWFFIKALALYKKIKILYNVEIDISNIKNSSYWNNKIFEVFITDLHNTLIETGYTIDQSNKIVKQHLIKSKILSFKYLYIMRFKTAYLNLEILLKYKNYINNKYLFYCFILLLFPVSKKEYI